MRRYYFHLHEDGERIEDEEGQELPDLTVARAIAVKSARAIIAHEVSVRGVMPLDQIIAIADQSGRIAGTVAFRDCVSLQLPQSPLSGST